MYHDSTLKHSKELNSSDGTLRDPDTARIHPMFKVQRVVSYSIDKMCFSLQVTSSKLASSAARPNSGGERPGVKWIATSKSSTSTCLTLLLGREGRVESNRYHSYGNATDIVATRFVSARYSPTRNRNGVGFKTIARFLGSVAGASWVMTKNCVCNCRFNPSLVSTPILRPLTS